jgi:hypothetical protein
MACDGTRVFVLGSGLSSGAQEDEVKLIHVLDTNVHPFCHFIRTVFKFETELLIYPKPDSKTVKHGEKTTQLAQKPSAGQPQHGIFSSSNSGAAHGATSKVMGRPAIPQITREQNLSLNGLPSRPTGASGRSRHVPEEDDDGVGSTEHHAKLVAPDAHSGKNFGRLEDGRLIALERQLSETLVAKTERDRHVAQLTNELAQKSALLKQAEEKAAEEKKCAGRELRELQAKLDESLLSRDHALKQAQSAQQKASCVTEANERSQRELAEMHAELEACKSELAASRLRLADAENGCGESNAEADTYRTQAATSLTNTDEDRVVHRLMERMQAMEAEISSLRGNEKSFDMMECRNEG